MSTKRTHYSSESETKVDELYRQIGQLKVDRDFLSTKDRLLGRSERKQMLEPDTEQPRSSRKAWLLKISRSISVKKTRHGRGENTRGYLRIQYCCPDSASGKTISGHHSDVP